MCLCSQTTTLILWLSGCVVIHMLHSYSLGIDTSRSQSPARSVSPSLFSQPSSVTNPVFIISPLLAFVKAFRLRGDTSTLKQAVTAHFDSPSLIEYLWDFCGDLLKELGVTYHTIGEALINVMPLMLP